MTLVDTDWSIDRDTGDIRYGGDDHNGSSPSYATVIQFHRWLQELADDAVATLDDELDITGLNPSQRSTDNIITLINGYNIDATAAEHLYDGSIIQDDGDTIYDGIVNFGNSDVQIQIIQDGAVLADDWWNHRDKVYGDGGLNYDDEAGISHRFMILVRDSGVDIDNRRLIGTCRRFNYTYKEFKINATVRGNNVLALNDELDLNNETDETTVSGWTTITNETEGYVLLDVDNNSVNEMYYSEWNKDTYSINDFYERMKWLTRDGSSSTLYGLNGELFRGITHEIAYSSLSGTFDDSYPVSWTGASAGTGQILADNGSDKMWIQILTGASPVGTVSLSQTSPDAASATAGTVSDRSALIKTPFVGQSTGSAIIGSYGLGLETTDLTSLDKLFDLTNAPISPPNNVQNTVGGLIANEDRVLVAPWDGVTLDSNNDPAITKDQLSLATALTTDNITEVQITESIPADTPNDGYIRVTDNNGLERRLHYQNWENGSPNRFYNIDTNDGNEDFQSVNADIGNDIYIAYIDDLITSGTTLSFTSVQNGSRDLVVIVRDGGGTPIKQFISAWSQGTSAQTITAIRTTDA